MQQPNTALHVNARDNVATVFSTGVQSNSPVTIHENDGSSHILTAATAIPYGHKIAVEKIISGSDIIKYGEVIGMATSDINPGDYVHVHNLDSKRARGDLKEEEI